MSNEGDEEMKVTENNTLAGKPRAKKGFGPVAYVEGTACVKDKNARAKIEGNRVSGVASVPNAPMI